MNNSHSNPGLFWKAVIILLAIGALFFLLPQKTKENSPEASSLVTRAPSVTATATEIEKQLGQTKIQTAVLMYHHVGPLPEKADDIRRGLTISAEEFESQLKYFKENGYSAVSLKKFDELREKRTIPKKLVILTFDDGYDDNFNYAFDLMKKYNATGTFFIITNKIGKSEYMSEEQIKELAKAGNEIGSHSVSHPSLEKYKGDSLNNELSRSKETLEKIVLDKIISFCYPSGKYNEDTVKAAQQSGYKYAVTTRSSNGEIDLDNPFEIARYRISAGRNIEAMLK